jgi:hypothetical protein
MLDPMDHHRRYVTRNSIIKLELPLFALLKYGSSFSIRWHNWKLESHFNQVEKITSLPPPMALPAHSGPWPLIQLCIHFSQTVTFLGRVISPSQGLYLNTEHKHRIKACIHQTSVPWMGFKPTIPASKQAKTIYALDLAATVTGRKDNYSWKIGILWCTGCWWPLRSKAVGIPLLTMFIGSKIAIVLKLLFIEYKEYILKA